MTWITLDQEWKILVNINRFEQNNQPKTSKIIVVFLSKENFAYTYFVEKC